MRTRKYIAGTLWGAALLSLIVLLAAALWVVLALLGDQPGSQGAKGVALVALAALVLDLVIMLLLLAMAEVGRPQDPLVERRHNPEPPL